MDPLGVVIRKLLSKRGFTSKELSRRVNLSETSLSKIVQGVTKPRQANLVRIIQELCRTTEEEQQIISAYARIEYRLDDEQSQRNRATIGKIEEERVRRYLQTKARQIAFRERVAATLIEAVIPFECPSSNDSVISDFLVIGPPRIAIECKANPSRDWDRSITSIRLLLTELPCDRVIIAVPSIGEEPHRRGSLQAEIVEVKNLIATLHPNRRSTSISVSRTSR